MDKKKSIINILTGIFFKIIVLFFSLLSRRYLIRYVGNDANGVISLFNSIIGILSVAELGVGAAVSFCMYKPITENDNKKVAALYNLLRKSYLMIGLILFVLGICIMPIVPLLAKDYELNYNIYLLYLIQLCGVIVTYTYSSKISLINAYKDNYITTILNSIISIIKSLLQIFILYLTKSLYFFMLIGFITEILQIIFLNYYTGKKYKDIIKTKEVVSKEIKLDVVKNIKALFLHKIGGLLVNTIDSVIISTFIGIIILGKYSNYILVISTLVNLVSSIFSQVTSIIGQSYYENSKENFKKYFYLFYFINYFVATFISVCFYACINPFINLFFGENLLLDDSIVIIITINYFIQFMESAVRLFKDSTGLFYHDRFKPLFEGLLNLFLSIIFVKIIGIEGVILSTIITNLLICHIVEPYVLFKYAFIESSKKYYLLNYSLITIFIIILFLYKMINQLNIASYLIAFLVNGIVASLFALPAFGILLVYFLKKFKKFSKSGKNCLEK